MPDFQLPVFGPEVEVAARVLASTAVLLTQSQQQCRVLVTDLEGVQHVVVLQYLSDNQWAYREEQAGTRQRIELLTDWEAVPAAALLCLAERYTDEAPKNGIRYTREGMIHRVMAERRQRSLSEKYRIQWGPSRHGEHILTTEKGIRYSLTLRDFEAETGYADTPDLRTNKLGTTKHLMFAFRELKNNPDLWNSLSDQYPFVEVYLDPLNDYRITWFYPHPVPATAQALLDTYFGPGNHVYPEARITSFLGFIRAAEGMEEICIRPEVQEKVEKAYNQRQLAMLAADYVPNYSPLKAQLFDYQKEGVQFALFKESCILADEMGLGKTLQAITTAILKKEIFDFSKTMIICPASLKSQWKREIEKFSHETAIVVGGTRPQRTAQYASNEAHFVIVNYETAMRDQTLIQAHAPDFLILDEAQRAKNYETRTHHTVASIPRKHALVLTGTPIENRLTDLYALMQLVDPAFLGPLWEFSYQHCIFDSYSNNRILGYFDLASLKQSLAPVLLRREKRNVLKQLPHVQHVDVPVHLHPAQADMHAGFAMGIAQILAKKFKTDYDWQKLTLLLQQMRMVCDSSFLVDKVTHHSPKLIELRHILLEKLDVKNSERKVIIFSEWTTMLHIIGEMLKEIGVGFVELTGKVPTDKRAAIVSEFEDNPQCQVFLSSEAGGSGLNLQVADTVINFELPWNPAKKNQRIGRIDRIGQRSKHLTVINFITKNSIETNIATGLMLKQNLFEGVLDTDIVTDEVDFSEQGRAQFIQQLESLVSDWSSPEVLDEEAIDEVLMEEATVAEDDILPQPTAEDDTADTPGAGTPALAPEGQPNSGTGQPATPAARAQQMEAVMNQGMQFLTGLFQMATGQTLPAAGQQIEVNPETGEVVLRFKMF